MSESAGRVVAWQVRHRLDDAWGNWYSCTEHYHIKFGGIVCETRALVPAQLLVDCEHALDISRQALRTLNDSATEDLHAAESKLAAVRDLAEQWELAGSLNTPGTYRPTSAEKQLHKCAATLRALTEKSEETR